MEELVANEIARPRTAAAVAMLFTTMAILVAAIGVYAVFAYDLAHRSRELAVRSAVGATPAQLFSAVVRASVTLGTLGAALGLVASSLLTRFLRAILFEVTPLDATSFGISGICLLAIVVAAAAVPARRASKVDPMSLLRSD
jgi:ABC-type antimicrobial peptide transport system permease subunit